jgi:hypothetical protein
MELFRIIGKVSPMETWLLIYTLKMLFFRPVACCRFLQENINEDPTSFLDDMEEISTKNTHFNATFKAFNNVPLSLCEMKYNLF